MLTLRCPRCPAQLPIPDGVDADHFLRAHGWVNQAHIPGGRAEVPLPGGRTGLVDVRGEVVSVPWSCGVGHATEIARARANETGNTHAIDGGSPEGRRRIAPLEPRDVPRPPEPTPSTCSCGATLDAPPATVAIAVWLQAHGWVSPTSCSTRCATLARLSAGRPPMVAVSEIPDQSYQATRARLTGLPSERPRRAGAK